LGADPEEFESYISGSIFGLNFADIMERAAEKRKRMHQKIIKKLAELLIKELTQKIESTDKLIDQIVYHLYGLTPKEIEIIEKSFKTNH